MAPIRKRPIRWAGRFGLAFAGYRLWRRYSNDLEDTAQHVEAVAPVPPDEVDPADLTSPGTVSDPELEERRAEEAAVRERESRASTLTKFDELRLEQESELHEHAALVAGLEPPAESS